jgi:hypothetical protein
MIHEARIIPLSGRPHPPTAIRSWQGDSRGNLIERFAPIGTHMIRYEVTVDDPTTWIRSWTAVTTWKRSSERMFEYACHEANYSLTDILRGARFEEYVR